MQRQRFSLRKYKFGLASVLLGTALVFGAGQARADEQCVHAQVEGVLDDGSGAIQLGGSQGRRGDLVDQRVAPPLLRTVVGPVNEGRGGGHGKCLPSAGRVPRGLTPKR